MFKIKTIWIYFSCYMVTGMGKSGLIGAKIAATFNSTGTPSQFLHPAEALHGDIGMVVTGDVVNHFQGIERGISKPQLYRMLVVPENDEWLAEVRSFLRELSLHPGVQLLVNHDREQLETTGPPIY